MYIFTARRNWSERRRHEVNEEVRSAPHYNPMLLSCMGFSCGFRGVFNFKFKVISLLYFTKIYIYIYMCVCVCVYASSHIILRCTLSYNMLSSGNVMYITEVCNCSIRNSYNRIILYNEKTLYKIGLVYLFYHTCYQCHHLLPSWTSFQDLF